MTAREIAQQLGISVVENQSMDRRGTWQGGNEIIINPNRADEYDVLHEVGHALAQYMCCKEHCEYTAHGVAIGLARLYDIDIKGSLDRINIYAGWTINCPIGGDLNANS